MKFPKSVHPEGWLDHLEKDREPAPTSARPAGAPLKPRTLRPSAKIRATDPLGGVRAEPMAASVPPIHASAAPAVAAPGANPARRSSSAMPWVVGVGAGIVLIGVAATMSRQFTNDEAPAAPPVMVGEAAQQPAPVASSPEDTLLAEAPPAAGGVAEEPQVAVPAPAAPVAAEPVVREPAPKRAESPRPAEAPRVAQAPQPDPAPVTRTLTPPETLAQVSPQPAPLEATPMPVTPQPVAPVVVPPAAEPVQPVQPPQVQPPQPPVLAQQTPPVPAADPADTGITVKVREALASDATLAAVPIAVSTDHGVVKLEGQAPDAQAKARATVVAAATSGVRGVDNRLTLPAVTVGALQNSGS